MTVRLKNRVTPRKPVGHNGNGNYNGNGNGNGNGKGGIAVTKKTKAEAIEEPVVIRVTRTVKKKLNGEAQEIRASSDQENPGQSKDEDTEIDLDTIEVRRFLVEPARVNYHYTLKRSVHYQGVDVGCSVSIPCYKEEIDDAMEEAKELVAARLKVENKKTGPVLDYLVEQRIKKDQELAERGIR